MAVLRLPPVIPEPEVPECGVIRTPPDGRRLLSLDAARGVIQAVHFSHHPEATQVRSHARGLSIEADARARARAACLQVILEMFKAWNNVKHHRFLDTDENKMVMPMPLFDYQSHQQYQFESLRERVMNDWRALVINYIRDNLNNVFKLFVNDPAEYEARCAVASQCLVLMVDL